MATRSGSKSIASQLVVTALATFVYVLGCCGIVAAEELDVALEATKARFQVPTDSDFAAARAELETAIAGLENHLKSDRLAANWKSYLRWNDMRKQLDAGNEASPNELRRIALQYYSDFPNLDQPAFRAVGRGLRGYANQLFATKQKDFKTAYAAKVDEVGKALAAYAAQPNEAAAAEIATGLRYLARYGNPGELLKSVRDQAYSKPNVFVHIDEELVVYGTRRNLNEPTQINEVILGTQIRGTGHTAGRLDAELRPNSEHAVLELTLRGTTTSNTVGSNRSARIYSTGSTTISGFKRVTIDEHGMVAEPSISDAKTNSQITGIGSTRGGISGCIVTRVASKRVAESKGQATAIASQKAKDRIRQRLDSEAAKQLEISNRDFRLRFRDPLKRSGTYPHPFNFSSTDDDLNIVALEAGSTQLGAPNDPPSLPGDHDLVIIAHESAVNNAGNTMFTGRKLLDTEIKAEIERRNMGKEIEQDENRDPWSITFADERPIHFQIRDGGFNVVLKFREFTSGERELKGVNISAAYKAEKEDTRLVFHRLGDLEIWRDGRPKDEKIPVGEVALRSVLRKKFSKLFKDKLEGKGLELPGKYKSLGKLPLGDYSMENGWAAIGWDLPSTKVALRK